MQLLDHVFLAALVRKTEPFVKLIGVTEDLQRKKKARRKSESLSESENQKRDADST